MAAGGGAGVVTVWDLEARRLATVLREAHDAPLTALHFFPGEPRLMSAAGDNSVKQWLFDNADGGGRLLRFRAGHAAPPACLRYYGDGTRLLSAGMRACCEHSSLQQVLPDCSTLPRNILCLQRCERYWNERPA